MFAVTRAENFKVGFTFPLRVHFLICRTPLHTAIAVNNSEAFSLLLVAGGLNLELKDSGGHTALWLALSSETSDSDDGSSYARQLIAHGSSPNTLVNNNGDLAIS